MAKKKRKMSDCSFCCITDCSYSDIFPFGCLIFKNDGLKLGVKCTHLDVTIDPKTRKATLVCKNKNVYFYGDKKKYKAT